jgi:predicted ArsR family transcriptional regulator
VGSSVTPDNSADTRSSEPEAAVPPGNTRQRVLEIKTDPATADWSLAQIVQALGVSRVTVHKHIHKLKKAGLL